MVGCPMKGVAAALLASLLVAGCVAKRPAPVTERTPSPTAPSAARPAPSVVPAERPATHTVKKGDTLFSIALDHGVDHRDLAAWNNIEQAKIRIGQELRLTAPSATATTAPLKTAPARVEARPLGEAGTPSPAPPIAAVPPGGNVKAEPLAVHVPYSDQAYGQLASIKPQPAIEPKLPARPDVERGDDDLDWIWPATGRVISGFN